MNSTSKNRNYVGPLLPETEWF